MNNLSNIATVGTGMIAGDTEEKASVVSPAANPGADASYKAKATEAAVKFEGFFIAHMLHQMRSSTRELSSEDSVFKDQVNSDMLDMADTLVADKMANQRAFGVADAILRQLLPPASGNNTNPPTSPPGTAGIPLVAGSAAQIAK